MKKDEDGIVEWTEPRFWRKRIHRDYLRSIVRDMKIRFTDTAILFGKELMPQAAFRRRQSGALQLVGNEAGKLEATL